MPAVSPVAHHQANSSRASPDPADRISATSASGLCSDEAFVDLAERVLHRRVYTAAVRRR